MKFQLIDTYTAHHTVHVTEAEHGPFLLHSLRAASSVWRGHRLGQSRAKWPGCWQWKHAPPPGIPPAQLASCCSPSEGTQQTQQRALRCNCVAPEHTGQCIEGPFWFEPSQQGFAKPSAGLQQLSEHVLQHAGHVGFEGPLSQGHLPHTNKLAHIPVALAKRPGPTLPAFLAFSLPPPSHSSAHLQ